MSNIWVNSMHSWAEEFAESRGSPRVFDDISRVYGLFLRDFTFHIAALSPQSRANRRIAQ